MKRIALLLLLLASPCLAKGQAASATAQEIVAAAGDARLVVLGEMHGTREIPALVAAVADEYSRHEPLLLALEMPRTEHWALARYMASDGLPGARAELRRRPYWNVADGSNDGRRSVDMLELIEAMRALRAAGRDVAIAPYDTASRSDGDRERAMADYVRRTASLLPRGRVLVLTGNVHAALQPRALPGIGGMFETMTFHLRQLQPYSIRISALAGEVWGCRKHHDCGVHVISGHGKSGHLGTATEYHHYQVMLPVFSLARLTGEDHSDF